MPTAEPMEKKGMSRDQTEALAMRTPSPALDAPDKKHTGKGAGGGAGPAGEKKDKGEKSDKGDKGEKAGAKGEKDGAGQQERIALPAEIAAQFRGVDITNVAVYRNSKVAKDKGVQGFATHDEIHIAPGADEVRVMRHEAAHVVQFRSGAGAKKHDDKSKNEALADNAETGKATDAKELGTAAPGGVRHKEEHGGSHTGGSASSANDHGAPQFQWNGIHFAGVSGNFEKKLAEHEFEPLRLFRVSTMWRIPAFPIAGLSVMAEATIDPEAKITANGTYAWNREQHKIQVGANLKGELNCSLNFRARGGLALDAVVQSGGVGLEAALQTKVYGEVSKAINFSINTETGAVELSLVPLDVDLGAQLNALLSLVAWTEGWFSNHVARWTFANFRIATFEGFKCPIEVAFNSQEGVQPHVGPVRMGQFHWGAPPEANEHNHH